MTWDSASPCPDRPDGEAHCLHPSDSITDGCVDEVCCLCGDLFCGEERRDGEHGEHLPARTFGALWSQP